MIGAILPPIKGYLTMQRNANMLKNLKKVSFCRFYWFLFKNAVPCLSPKWTFVLRNKFTVDCVLDSYKGGFIFCVGK